MCLLSILSADCDMTSNCCSLTVCSWTTSSTPQNFSLQRQVCICSSVWLCITPSQCSYSLPHQVLAVNSRTSSILVTLFMQSQLRWVGHVIPTGSHHDVLCSVRSMVRRRSEEVLHRLSQGNLEEVLICGQSVRNTGSRQRCMEGRVWWGTGSVRRELEAEARRHRVTGICGRIWSSEFGLRSHVHSRHP